jgi:Polysaccharide deacetylase
VRKSNPPKLCKTDVRVSRVLAFHAEKLHDELVWSRVRPLAHWMARKGMRATFFVYPFRAQVVGKDITDRVRMLAALGHEIGQHTHFYAGTKIDNPEKINDLSDGNIVQCLHRDFETLRKTGSRPRGFTAGAWRVNQTVWDALVELGFLYDCSARFYDRTKVASKRDLCWLQSPQFYTNSAGRLLCVPTTCSLGEWFKWRRHMQIGASNSYQLVYLHDYDLLSRRVYLLTWLLLLASRKKACDAYDVYAREVGAESEPNGKLLKNTTT